ncbi:hypothetical protein LRC484719_42030 [Mycobacterium riyadhense]
MDLVATVGEPHLPGWHGPAALRGETRLIGHTQPGELRTRDEAHDSSRTPLLLLHCGLFDIHQQLDELLPGKLTERLIDPANTLEAA